MNKTIKNNGFNVKFISFTVFNGNRNWRFSAKALFYMCPRPTGHSKNI